MAEKREKRIGEIFETKITTSGSPSHDMSWFSWHIWLACGMMLSVKAGKMRVGRV